jgi:hypothetical protein
MPPSVEDAIAADNIASLFSSTAVAAATPPSLTPPSTATAINVATIGAVSSNLLSPTSTMTNINKDCHRHCHHLLPTPLAMSHHPPPQTTTIMAITATAIDRRRHCHHHRYIVFVDGCDKDTISTTTIDHH